LDAHIRPVNLRTDLAQLADLMELVFADTMDSNGRAALEEMRMLSRMPLGLGLIGRISETGLGMGLGYVWVEEERVIGNVSVAPAHWPRDLGEAWIVANVGVHHDYQRRGIAQQLMEASLDLVRRRGGRYAILQVDASNETAVRLYERMGFHIQRSWTTWRRPATIRVPAPVSPTPLNVRRRRPSEWRAEYELAARVRPHERGGVGWLRPLHPSLFRPSVLGALRDFLLLRAIERLVIVRGDRYTPDDPPRVLASLWIENVLAAYTIPLWLMVDPDYAGLYDDALLQQAVRRYSGSPISIEHPADEHTTNDVLMHYGFRQQRTVHHMLRDDGAEVS
jgi:ribosomal protein S18 acetylase RimI-like enzyme